MPLPVFLYVLWAAWPLATFAGGKLFAPLIFLFSLFALPTLRRAPFNNTAKALFAFFCWICFSAIWSPAETQFMSGSLADGDFAIEAAYLRFALTCLGGVLFLKLVADAPAEKVRPALIWVCAAIGVQVITVGAVAAYEDALMMRQGEGLIPSAQSMGRNMNLLVMALPVLLGAILMRGQSRKHLALIFGLIALVLGFATMMDGLAVFFALMIALGVLAILQLRPQTGFRTVANLTGLAWLLMPALVWVMNILVPVSASYLPLSTAQRFAIWQATLEKIAEKPLHGHGINAASTWTETYASRPDLLAQLTPAMENKRVILYHPHNMGLQLWVETGLVGVGLAALVLVLFGRTLPAPASLPLGIKVAAAGIFGAALSYFSVSYNVWDESFWASIAVVASGFIILARQAKA